MKLYKENVVDEIIKNKGIKIYISSSLKNLEYYHIKTLNSGYDSYLITVLNDEYKEKIDINTKLINLV